MSRTMLDQPKTSWLCECGDGVFAVLLCPECKGEASHIVGFQCVNCEVIHVTLSANPSVYAENEDVFH